MQTVSSYFSQYKSQRKIDLLFHELMGIGRGAFLHHATPHLVFSQLLQLRTSQYLRAEAVWWRHISSLFKSCTQLNSIFYLALKFDMALRSSGQ